VDLESNHSNTILFIADFGFLPSNAGNKIRVASLVSALKSWGYKIHFLALNKNGSISPEEKQAMENEVDCLEVFDWNPKLDPWQKPQSKTILDRVIKKIIRLIKQRLKLWPEPLNPDSKYICPDFFCKIVEEKSQQHLPRAIISEYLYFSRCLLKVPSEIIKIIDTHDAMHVRLKEYRKSGIYSFFHCTLKDEVRCLNRADKVLAIQEEEANIFKNHLKKNKVMYLPYATEANLPTKKKRHGHDVLFVGAPHGANKEGLIWFIDKVWPKIQEKVINARLIIVGKIGPIIEKELKLNSTSNINILGPVKNLSNVYHQSRIAVIPIFRGSGLKIKTIEALSHGLPIVSTPKGVEGIADIEKCSAVRIESTEDDFSSSVIEFLENEKNYEMPASDFIKDRYSPSVAYKVLKDYLH